MGFPSTYKIRTNFYQSYKQIGNSVVVPIIEKLAFKILEMLEKIIIFLFWFQY